MIAQIRKSWELKLDTARALERFFDFEDMGTSFENLETPVPIVDFDIMLVNLQRWQSHCDKVGIANWPHIKTHKLVPVAKLQMALGAKGICVQKLGEAEVMAKAGIKDMLLTFNIVGRSKLERLSKLMQSTNIAVVADSEAILEGLSHAAVKSGRSLEVLVECDTGGGRNGVQSPHEALRLAQKIHLHPNLKVGGLMTYPPSFKRDAVAAYLAEAKHLFIHSGLSCNRVSSGGSPDMWDKTGLADVTEYRAGTYIYNDRSLVAAKACGWEDCAETVLTTVVSTPTTHRAIVDAGTKALTSDMLGLEGFGIVRELGDAKIYKANEEHGYLDTSAAPRRVEVGETLRIVMNHTCPVNNLFDKVVFVRGQKVLGALKIDARGKMQ